jgi:hypothetical protein
MKMPDCTDDGVQQDEEKGKSKNQVEDWFHTIVQFVDNKHLEKKSNFIISVIPGRENCKPGLSNLLISGTHIYGIKGIHLLKGKNPNAIS